MQAVVVARGLYACTVEFVLLVIFWQAKAWISVWFTLSPVRVLIWDAGAQPLLIVIWTVVFFYCFQCFVEMQAVVARGLFMIHVLHQSVCLRENVYDDAVYLIWLRLFVGFAGVLFILHECGTLCKLGLLSPVNSDVMSSFPEDCCSKQHLQSRLTTCCFD